MKTVDWGISCGRAYLSVNGYVLAYEGDILRDVDLAQRYRQEIALKYAEFPDLYQIYMDDSFSYWTTDIIKFVAGENLEPVPVL